MSHVTIMTSDFYIMKFADDWNKAYLQENNTFIISMTNLVPHLSLISFDWLLCEEQANSLILGAIVFIAIHCLR